MVQKDRVKVLRGLFVLFLSLGFLLNCEMKDREFEKLPLIKHYQGYTIVFEAEPWPVVPMKRTIFRLKTTPPLKADKVLMELTMPGMYMGQNRVVLKRVSDGVFQGTGVVVRCPSGKTLWRATFTAEGFGPVSFDFHVRK